MIRKIDVESLNTYKDEEKKVLTHKIPAEIKEAYQGAMCRWQEWYADHPVLVPHKGQVYLVFEEMIEYQESYYEDDAGYRKSTSFRFPGEGDDFTADWWLVKRDGNYVVCRNENDKNLLSNKDIKGE